MKEFILKYYGISPLKIKVINNGIDNTIFPVLNSQDKNKIKQELGFALDEKIVLFSGRLDANKGLYFLLDAFTEVLKQTKNVRLIIIGEDSGPDKICQFLTHCENIWSKITFTGFIKYEQIYEFYQIADVGVIPSVFDHCPFVALEMISYNIPLIISDTEGLNELLTNKQSIYLKPILDSDGNLTFDKMEIAQAILSLLTDHEKTASITKDYPELMRTKFSGNKMGGDFYSVLKELQLITIEA